MTIASKLPDFAAISSHFQFTGDLQSVQLIDVGHIHDTYALTFSNQGGVKRYILQQINTHVFRSPRLVMENIRLVSNHLRARLLQSGGNPERESLTLIPTQEGSDYYTTKDGDVWRAMLLIEGARTHLTLPERRLYQNASQAFGRFQRLLADFPAEKLHITIPDFHHTSRRLQAFECAAAQDVSRRLASARPEVDFLLQRRSEAGRLIELQEQGKIPLRVTHNDTKLDNVLIDDQTGEGVCVIDLDTVMPGLSLYDFGDTVRSAANTAAEDELDLDKVHFDLDIFELLVRGYLLEMRNLLTRDELENLAFGAWLIIYEQAMRFLTDYLNGDTYYRTAYPDHNLARCRTQIKLIQEMEDHFAAVENIIHRVEAELR